MKEITLSTYLQLRKKSEETELNEFSKKYFDETEMTPTKEAYDAKNALDNAKPVLGAEEYIKLTNETDLESLGISKYQAKYILGIASASITLPEYHKLKEEAKETVETDFVDITTGGKLICPTQRASAIQQLLASCKITLTPEEYKQLSETSKKQEVNDYAKKIFDVDEMVYTDEAKEAQKILASAQVNLSVDQLKQIIKDSTEQEEFTFPGFDPMMRKTDKAQMATSILGHSNIVISSLDEYVALRNSITRPFDMPEDYIPGEYTISDSNILSQYIFNHNILLDFGDRAKFTTMDIGKGTLDAQSDTKAKQYEEQSRENNRESSPKILRDDYI